MFADSPKGGFLEVPLTKNALELIHQASGGTMRAIGTITTASLRKAFLAKGKQVETEHIQSVLQR